jgi:hypothetical protein
MAISVVVNGTTYSLPTSGDVDWGADLSSFLQALAGEAAPWVAQFGAESSPADTVANYLRPGYTSGAADTVEASVRCPFSGLVSGLYVQCTTGPATSGQTITVRKNGADQTLTALLAAAGTQASDVTHSFSVSAGDRLSVKVQGVAGITVGAVKLVVSMALTHQ